MKLGKLLSRKAEIEKAIAREQAREKRRDEVFALLDKLDLLQVTDDEIRAALHKPKAKKEAGSADAKAG